MLAQVYTLWTIPCYRSPFPAQWGCSSPALPPELPAPHSDGTLGQEMTFMTCLTLGTSMPMALSSYSPSPSPLSIALYTTMTISVQPRTLPAKYEVQTSASKLVSEVFFYRCWEKKLSHIPNEPAAKCTCLKAELWGKFKSTLAVELPTHTAGLKC